MGNEFKMPVGVMVGTSLVRSAGIAALTGDAEKIFVKKPSATKLYTWFGQLASLSIRELGDVEVSAPFQKQKNQDIIPKVVQDIPLNDIGTLLLQIQRELWEDTLKDQKISCTSCSSPLEVDIELNKIKIPDSGQDEAYEFILVDLGQEYTIATGMEALQDYEGQVYNHAKFRVPLLSDALRYEKIHSNDIEFWRSIAHDCLISLVHKVEGDDEVREVTSGYINKRGKLLWKKDWTIKSMKNIRRDLQGTLPTALLYYEEDCPVCSNPTPMFARVNSFFST